MLSPPYFTTTVSQNALTLQNDKISGNITASINNETNAFKQAELVLAIYDINNKLIGTVKQIASLNAGSNTVSFENVNIPATSEDTYNYKLLLLDSVSNIMPLSDFVSGNIQ